MNPLTDKLIAAIESTGFRMIAENREHLIALADSMSDELINAALNAFANNLPTGGVKSWEWTPIESAIRASLPEIDDDVNKQIQQLSLCFL